MTRPNVTGCFQNACHFLQEPRCCLSVGRGRDPRKGQLAGCNTRTGRGAVGCWGTTGCRVASSSGSGYGMNRYLVPGRIKWGRLALRQGPGVGHLGEVKAGEDGVAPRGGAVTECRARQAGSGAAWPSVRTSYGYTWPLVGQQRVRHTPGYSHDLSGNEASPLRAQPSAWLLPSCTFFFLKD